MAKRVDAVDEKHINSQVSRLQRRLVDSAMSFHYSPMVEAALDQQVQSRFPTDSPTIPLEVDEVIVDEEYLDEDEEFVDEDEFYDAFDE